MSATCGEPVPFRDPTGSHECILPPHDGGGHRTRMYGEDGVTFITYLWVDNPGDRL